MQDVGAVDVLKATENLVDKGLEVGVGQRLTRTDDGSKIALHELWKKLSEVRLELTFQIPSDFTHPRTSRSR